MLRAAIAFLILSLVAAVLGFSGLAGTSSSIAQILFVLFLVLFLSACSSGGRSARATQGDPTASGSRSQARRVHGNATGWMSLWGRPRGEHLQETKMRGVILQRMATVREAFRLQRLAYAHRGLWLFYLEHNLFDEAQDERLQMIEHLRGACQQWRLTLGTAG